MARIYIGTSGWHYDHWIGPFYPEGTKPRGFLTYYAQQFSTVEINATFYRLPAIGTVCEWRDATPVGFVFACKASRYITHMKKLTGPHEGISRFLETMGALEEKLGPVLFQLPPRWHADPGRLEAFLKMLPGNVRYAFEFRDETWFSSEVAEKLRRHNAAFCIYDLAGRHSTLTHTADFVYVWLHGPDSAYHGSYDERTLQGWARRFEAWRKDGRDVYCYFNNDPEGHAVRNAFRIKSMVGA
ncbi:MAG: DUF72 domain-containing protein [Hyphomicrobiales bacterium]|nr:DUF72 domain-containing protein [Hyphomicrobiales bacterium]MCP5000730.1 DUF72 domain-containing protein [Hyphomicrobiales bacterium]